MDKITGYGLSLIPYDAAYKDELFQVIKESQKEIAVYETWCTEDFSMETAEAVISWWTQERARKAAYYYLVFKDSQLVGSCGLNSINYEFKKANLGYWIKTAMTGQGIATIAAKLVVDMGFNKLALNRIYCEICEDNYGSIRVIEKIGGKIEGTLRNSQILPSKGIVNTKMISILKNEMLAG